MGAYLLSPKNYFMIMKNAQRLLSLIAMMVFCTALFAQQADLSTMYNLTKPDTMHFTKSASSHLSAIKEGTDLVVLDSYGEGIDERGHVKSGGYSLSRFSLAGGKYSPTLEGNPTLNDFNGRNGVDFNTFLKIPDGYLVCGTEMMMIFSNELKAQYACHGQGHLFLSAAPLKGGSEVALLSVSLARAEIEISIYDYKKKAWQGGFQPLIEASKYGELSAAANRLVQTSDGNLFVTLNVGGGMSEQIFGKLNLEKVRAESGVDEFMIWEIMYDLFLTEMKIDANGLMDAIVRLPGETEHTEKLQHVKANANVGSSDDFEASITSKKTATFDESITGSGACVKLLPDGSCIEIGIGLQKFGYHKSLSIAKYSPEMKLLRQYRLPTPFETMDQNDREYGNFGVMVARNISRIILNSNGTFETYAPSLLPTNNIRTDPKMFYDYHIGNNAVWTVLPGETKDELLLITGSCIQKVNLLKYTPCTQRATPWDREAEELGIEANYVPPAKEEKPTVSSGNVATSKPVVAAASTKITIKNDLTAEQNGKYGQIKLAFSGGSMATTTILRNHTLEIDCKSVDRVHAGNEMNTSLGRLLFNTDGNCGKTVNLSSVW
jgi:hypothetical protein